MKVLIVLLNLQAVLQVLLPLQAPGDAEGVQYCDTQDIYFCNGYYICADVSLQD